MRLLLHGRLTMVVQQMTVLLHASLDPYNTTEEMELTWNQVIMDWTNGICLCLTAQNNVKYLVFCCSKVCVQRGFEYFREDCVKV